MTTKIDGTNGVLQAYDYQVLTTGFSYTFTAGTQTLIVNPAGTLATGTITMPASPVNGMTITVSSSKQITALTLQGNTGQSITGAATFLPANGAVSYVYRLANTTWFPCQTVAAIGSQLVNGTAQATTSGTSVSFTGIPSWVKRVTVMFDGVSGSSSSDMYIELGTGATPTYASTGYNSYVANLGNTGLTGDVLDTAFIVGNVMPSGYAYSGALVFSSFGSNTWVLQGMLGSASSSASNGGQASAGGVTLGAALTALRVSLSTANFDAGSINILYE